MRKDFFEYYDPTQDEIEQSWADAIFIFDTNAIINLYRYTPSTSQDLLKVLTSLKDKLHMPYQVGFEYQENRRSMIQGLNGAYTKAKEILDDHLNKLSSDLKILKKHPHLNIDKLKEITDEFEKNFKDELDLEEKNHTDYLPNDTIRDELDKLYESKIGKAPTDEELAKIFKEGAARYEKKIPPGYEDLAEKRKKGERNIYGDLIIWKAMIDFAKEQKKKIIFITDDAKEDWWLKENGKTLGPRRELTREFLQQSGQTILIYSATSFLHFAKERKLIDDVKEATIAEVEEVRKADEKRNQYISIKSTLVENIRRMGGSFTADGSVIFPTEPVKSLSSLNGNLWDIPGLITQSDKDGKIYYTAPQYPTLATQSLLSANVGAMLNIPVATASSFGITADTMLPTSVVASLAAAESLMRNNPYIQVSNTTSGTSGLTTISEKKTDSGDRVNTGEEDKTG